MILRRDNARILIPILGVVLILIVLLVAGGRRDVPPGDEAGGSSTLWTCSMHPQVRQDEPGDCPLCGMRLVAAEQEVTPGVVWTCSMHPQVRQPEPGDCPICGMDLIPVEDEDVGGASSERRLSVSEAGRKLMEIETAAVVRRSVYVDVPLVGRVTYDEDRVASIAAWVPGRVDELHVDYVGYEVRAGEPMLELYGPSLLAAQEELIQSADAYRAASTADATASAEATLEAVRSRLELWGLSADQIAEIESRGTAEPHVEIRAPVGGTVVVKTVAVGDYVSTGQTLFKIADLSRVWIELSAYESDLAWLSVGQVVEFSAPALPGETFLGQISFVEPVVDPSTRTVTVRAEVDNLGGRLKPDMFVTATAHAVADSDGGRPPLVIPATAPLLTGERAVVYVEIEDAPQRTFEGREVVLGPRAGDYYVVVSGLSEHERVVTEGAFKIDSALQIRARPSMMSPDGGSEKVPPAAGHSH